MGDKGVVEAMRVRFEALGPVMDERVRRQWAGAEATAAGRGGIAAVAAATGMSPTTVRAGVREVRGRAAGVAADAPPPGRVRRKGGGRKSLAGIDPALAKDLDALVGPTARGDPTSPLRWTCKST